MKYKWNITYFHVFYLIEPSNSILARDECLFCRKKKTEKGSGYEKLIVCSTYASASNLLKYRDTSVDSYAKVQLATLDAPTVIAKEFKYHRTCYKSWPRQKDNVEKDPEAVNETVQRNKCFDELKEFVQEQIIEKGFFTRLKTLANRYSQLQEQQGITVKGTIVRNLKERLVREFGDKLSFFQKTNGSPEIMYGTEECLFDCKYNLNQSEIVSSCAKIIRKELLESEGDFSSWPPTECQLSSGSSLDLPLTKLLVSSILSKTKSARNDRLTSSIVQDLLYNTTKGKVRTKKHVQLGVSIKRKTASVAVLRWLNRFGHSISYDEVNAIETKIARNQCKNIRKYVPNNIQPSTFVTFVYDNCDHNAESIYNVTMHATNGIVIQRTNGNVAPSLSTVSPTKRRSFKPVYKELAPYITKGKRKCPEPLPNIETGINNMDGLLSSLEDLVWHFLRFENARRGNQTLPGWKGFFHLVTEPSAETHTIGYLPPIDKSPTHLDTVQEVLIQCKEKAQALDLLETDLVLDHAIYAKAIEIIMDENNEHLKSFINLRMGGFHAACIFLGVIGKRFGDAGLKDIIVESGLFGENSTDQLLRGNIDRSII